MTRAERERLAGIRYRAIQAREAWRKHRQLCRSCSQLSRNRNQYCTTGWDIRLELHQAERALAREKQPEIPGQQALF